jgi:hypothetical protein
MKRPAPDELPVSIDFYYLVGRVTVISSMLEKSTYWLLVYLKHYVNRDDLGGWEYEEDKTSKWWQKAKAIRSLMARRGWTQDEVAFVSEWLDEVQAFREVRNDLAHSYWLSSDTTEEHSKYTLDARDWKFEDGPVTLHDLRQRVATGEGVIYKKQQVADLAIASMFGPS